jgi:hypothetical protein
MHTTRKSRLVCLLLKDAVLNTTLEILFAWRECALVRPRTGERVDEILPRAEDRTPREGWFCMSVGLSHAAGKPKLLEVVRERLRAGYYSLRTEDAYLGWIRRFVAFHRRRHPRTMGAPEVTAFLTDLAVQGNVSASTQNQAFSALLFPYANVLEQPLGPLQAFGRNGRASCPSS